MHSTRFAGLICAVLTSGACVGSIDAPPPIANGPETPPVVPPLMPVPRPKLKCVTPAVAPSPMRRLSHTEYDNAVRDLLGDTTRPGRAFTLDTQSGLFDNTATEQRIGAVLAEQYLDTAVQLAEAIPDPKVLAGCDFAAATCAKSFIQKLGRRAFRRPLTPDEVTSFVALFDKVRLAADPAKGARAIVAAVLTSPNFLFRPEYGVAPAALANARTLGQFELAGRLSTLFWSSVPDEVLLDAAAAGKLSTPAEVEAQARRLMADDRAKEAIAAFYGQWLGLPMLTAATKDPATYPDFNDGLKASMAEESRRFVSDVLWKGDAKWSTLLTSRKTFVNKSLAKVYGVAGPADDATFVPATLDANQRSGIVTQASMLTAFARTDDSSPVKRGLWIRQRLLCQDLPAPPANVPPLPPIAPGVSNRERFLLHTKSLQCSGCHSLIDGLGTGLEHYDGTGAFRTEDRSGEIIDATGEITKSDIDGKFQGGPALAAQLAKSEEVRDCVTTQWLRFALARAEKAEDACAQVELRGAFAATGGDLRELMVALTQTTAFLNYRQAP